MSPIKTMQNAFCEGVLGQNKDAIIQEIRKTHITAEFRLNIYRTTILQNLRTTLEIIFPGLWKLVGDECANSLAYAFIRDKENFPSTSCLDDWGDKFPDFLNTIESVAHLHYLKDIAQIEWLRHLSYCSQDYKPLDPVLFQKTYNNSLEKLHLVLNPTVFLYSSHYGLKDIFDLIDSPNEHDQVDLQCTPCYVAITRQRNQVVTHWLSKEIFEFLNCINREFTLMQSYECVLEANPDFDLASALQFMFEHELLSHYA